MRFGSETVHLPENIFAILRDLIRERVGLCFENEKRDLLADKLSSRVVERGFDSFLDYYYLLKYGPGGDEEWPLLMDALSVPETYFWREMDQIRSLVDVLMPRHVAAKGGLPVTIWCAACATGEEPLTIAMALSEAGWLNRVPVRIRASDASGAALSKARKGLYRERSFRALPPPMREKYFTKEGDLWRVDPVITAPITWSQANLLSVAEVTPLARSTFVFCRNVFIYFSSAGIAATVRLFAEGISRPGYLFVGAAESLLKVTAEFELQEIGGAFVYVKTC